MLQDLTPEEVTRFWSRVLRRGDDDCWPWVLGTTHGGYGRTCIKGQFYRTHRVAYAIHTGQDPGDFNVLHECDNPPCCNPKQLIMGTQRNNAEGMVARGRKKGSRYNQTLARSYKAEGLTHKQIAEAIGCPLGMVAYLLVDWVAKPSTAGVIHGRHAALPVLTFYEIAKFWESVIRRGDDECWPCISVEKKWGYGVVTIRRRPWRASRIAYFLEHGEDPKELQVRHKCDNPPCCNPKHLLIGTPADDGRDRAIRGRSPKTRFSKVLAQSYREQGLSLRAIAEVMGASTFTIQNLLSGKYDRED